MTDAERLSPDDGRRLLELARASIAAGLRDAGRPFSVAPETLPPGLRAVRGGFVTLKADELVGGPMASAEP